MTRRNDRIQREAEEIAATRDLSQIAMMISYCAPRQRHEHSVSASIPWELIEALRIQFARVQLREGAYLRPPRSRRKIDPDPA